MDKVIFKPKILIRKSKIAKIAGKMNCSGTAVYKALSYDSCSQLSNEIRKTATQTYGGILVQKYPYLVED